MSRASRKWLRRVLFASLAVLAMLVLLALLVLGTERGTRFALRQVANYSPLEIDADGATGTLLTEIGLPSLAYRDEMQSIRIDGVVLNIDWSASGFRSLIVDRLSLASVTIETREATPPERKPLEISMPALPVRFRLRRASLDTLTLDQLSIENIALRDFRARGKRLELREAAANTDDVTVEIRNTHIELDGEVPLGGDASWRLTNSNLAGHGTLSGSLQQIEVMHELEGDYHVATQGTVQLLHRLSPAFDLHNQFTELRYADWTATNGKVHVSGTVDEYRLAFDSVVAAERGISATIRGTTGGNPRGFEELDVAATIDGSELQVQGSVAWAPRLALDLKLNGRNVDPASFVDVPASSLDGKLLIKATGTDDFVVDILSLSGIWNEQAANVRGQLSRTIDSWYCRACRASVGSNRVNVDGGLRGQVVDGSIDIDAPSLDQLWPGLKGTFNGKGRLNGTLALPILSGEVSGQDLGFGAWSLTSLSLASQDSTPQDLDVAVAFTGLALDDAALGSGRVDIAGAPENLEVSADWRLTDYTAAVRLTADIAADTLVGSIEAASISEPLSGTWSLDTPVNVAYSPGNLRVGAASWSNAEATLQHNEILQQQDRLTLAASLNNGPLTVFNALLPQNVRIDGRADARVELRHDAEGWNGVIEWRQQDTQIQFIASNDEKYDSTLPLAELTVKLDGNAATVRAQAQSEHGTEALLDAFVNELSLDSDLSARLQFGGDQWDWVPMLAPDIDNFAGEIRADIRANGKLKSPDLQGDLTWTEGQLAVPALNLPLSGIEVTLSGSSAGDMLVSGDANSGDGNLRVRGRLDNVTSASPSFDIKLLGERATLLNWQDYMLVASPNLAFVGDLRGVRVTGRVAMDKAEIIVKELPQGAVAPSDDVVVVGRDPDARTKTRVSGEVELELSENVHIVAFGLDTNLEGQLRFIVPENRAPQGMGELRLVGGVFEAYGQRLQIESGTMVFTGPLDDPLINVRAVRKIDSLDGTVTVGIQLAGRTRDLSSTVFSDPSMSEAEALSYLVLGRPLSQASAADGSILANSAYSLGLRQAALITNQIGQAVGLDELTVGGSNQNTTELIAGKQINSRLYARFAYGVFSRIGGLLMRYKLTESFSIEIGAGESQSMDILYTIERE